MGNSDSRIEDNIFEMRFASKQLDKESKREMKQFEANKRKVKKALEDGNQEIAQVYANNAIRSKNQALNLLKLSARMESVSQRMNSALKMNQLSRTMPGIVKTMNSCMQSMDIEGIMDAFESSAEELDVQADVVNHSSELQGIVNSQAVENLMSQIADENGMDVASRLEDAPIGRGAVIEEKVDEMEEADLDQRMKKLMGI